MAETLGGLGRLTELRQRLLFVLMALIVYRIGTFIPVPGVNPAGTFAVYEFAAGNHHRCVQPVHRWRTGAFFTVCTWRDALHFCVDHHAVDVQRGSAVAAVEKRGLQRTHRRLPSTPVTSR